MGYHMQQGPDEANQRWKHGEASAGSTAPPGSPISYRLTQEQTDKFLAWSKGRNGQGPIGGRITLSFSETSIGVIVKAKDQTTGEELDLSDYENW